MIVHGIILAVAGPVILVVGIILLEPLAIALGAVASGCAAWIIRDEAKWWQEVLGKGPTTGPETLALGAPGRLRRPLGRADPIPGVLDPTPFIPPIPQTLP
jgi:hypothetical protein